MMTLAVDLDDRDSEDVPGRCEEEAQRKQWRIEEAELPTVPSKNDLAEGMAEANEV